MYLNNELFVRHFFSLGWVISWKCCSLAPRHVCLFTGGMFDFLLTSWPLLSLFCLLWKKKISVCPVLWYHHLTYLVFRLRWGWSPARWDTQDLHDVDGVFIWVNIRKSTAHARSECIRRYYSHSLRRIAATFWVFPELWVRVGACTCALVCQHADLSFSVCELTNFSLHSHQSNLDVVRPETQKTSDKLAKPCSTESAYPQTQQQCKQCLVWAVFCAYGPAAAVFANCFTGRGGPACFLCYVFSKWKPMQGS